MSKLLGVGSPLRLSPLTNFERMYALDEAWNARDWDTFDALHDHDHVVVYWPGREKDPNGIRRWLVPWGEAVRELSGGEHS